MPGFPPFPPTSDFELTEILIHAQHVRLPLSVELVHDVLQTERELAPLP
jgi:hypothetical protein